MAAMRLRDFFDQRAVGLELTGASKDEVIGAMVALLGVDERTRMTLTRLVQRRELIGSTGIGRGIAIPHCRSLSINRLRVAFGRHRDGVDFAAVDQRPVHAIFLIVAPPNEVSNQYLPVLGRIAQLAKEPDVPDRLRQLASPEEFFGLLDQKGV
jgi:mannitol/fructose-specific phosphotransferase system IIA component (Ntr-type)